MAKQVVTATAHIQPGEAVVVYQGLARPVFMGESWKGSTVQALNAIAKGDAAILDPVNGTIKRKGTHHAR